jgi:hypothetical protein
MYAQWQAKDKMGLNPKCEKMDENTKRKEKRRHEKADQIGSP